MPFRLLLLGLLTATGLAADCRNEESARRVSIGISGTPEGAALVASRIANVVETMGGAVPSSDGTPVTLAGRMAFYQVPGLTVAVVHDGRVEWVEAFGTRGEGDATPLGPWCYLQGASLSKLVTAVAALRAVEAGLLELDAPLADALASWDVPDNAFTQAVAPILRQALSHHAGFNVPSFFGYASGGPIPTVLQTLAGQAPSIHGPITVFQTPGSLWTYSGGGYVVVQQTLEDVTGDYATWVREQVFEPAGMFASGFFQPAPAGLLDHAAIPNANGSDLLEPRTYPESAAAGLWTNALDLARLVAALQRSLFGQPGAILAPATAAAMFMARAPGPVFSSIGLDPFPGMGLGAFLVNESDPTWFWHTGENLGYTSVVVGSLERGDGVVVMTNGQRFFFGGGRVLAWEIVDAVARTYGWSDWGDWGH